MSLYETKTNDLRDVQNAQDNYAAAAADTAAAQATLQTATSISVTLRSLPRLMAISQTSTPAQGPMSTQAQQLLALVDSSSFWIAAYFKETQLEHIREGARRE